METLKHEIETATPPPYGFLIKIDSNYHPSSIGCWQNTQSCHYWSAQQASCNPSLEIFDFFLFCSKKAVHSWLTHDIAHLWDVPGHFHLSEPALLRMVSVRRRNLPEHIMVDAQRNCLDEKQAFPEPESQSYLHHHRHHGPAILDTGNNRQFVSVLMVPSRSKRPRQYSILIQHHSLPQSRLLIFPCISPVQLGLTCDNSLYFNNINDLFKYTRPYEALFRDPWWIYTCCSLFWNIKRRYEFGIVELCRVSPRFAVLLMAMTLSVGFIIVDILSVTHAIGGKGAADGINVSLHHLSIGRQIPEV